MSWAAGSARLIFRRYVELGSVNELVRNLRGRNVRTKTKKLSTGATRGGIPFGACAGRTRSLRISQPPQMPSYEAVPHRFDTKAAEQRRIMVFAGIAGRQQRVTDEDRIGAGEQAQGLQLIGHRGAAR